MLFTQERRRTLWADLKCALLAISAFSLLTLWGSAINKVFILLTALVWLLLWKKIRRNIPAVGRGDAGYIAFGTLFSALSGIGFLGKHMSTLELTGASVSSSLIILLAVAGSLVAIPFTVSFTKFLVTRFDDKQEEVQLPPCRPFFSRWPTLCFLLGIVGILCLIVMSFSYDIWVDEAFSLNLIKHSYAEVISLTAIDVHPPLYYLILKVVVDGVHVLLPSFPSIFVAKLVSVLAYLILMLIIATKARRDWGVYVASLAAVCLVGMSRQIDYGIEIRMYGWGMLFVTLAFLWMKNILTGKKVWAWVLFVFFGLCAAYTHYYACIAVGFLYLGLLIGLWMNDRRRLWQWVVAAVVTAIGYLPWLLVLVRQLRTVSESYWIDDITLGTVWSYIVYIFACPFFLLTIIAVFVATKKRKSLRSFKDIPVAYTGILVPIGVILVGVAVSLLMRPVFYDRYILPGLCCLWIGVLILVDRLGSRLMKTVIAVIMVAMCAVNVAYFTYSQGKYLVMARETMAFVRTNRDVVFVGNHSHPLRTLAELSGSDCYLWEEEPSVLSAKVYGNVNGMYNAEEISALLDEGETVFVVINEDKQYPSIEEILQGSRLQPTYIATLRVSNLDVKFYRIARP